MTRTKFQVEQVNFVSGVPATGPPTPHDIRLELKYPISNDSLSFDFSEQTLGAISIPTNPLAVDESAPPPRLGEKRPTDQRAWMCTETGWLSLDATTPRSKIDPTSHAQGAIRGVLELEEIVHALQEAIGGGNAAGEPLSGMLVQVQAIESSFVEVELLFAEGGSPDRKLSLHVQDPLTTVVTPDVWYRPLATIGEADGSVDASLDTAQPETAALKRNQVPSLTSSLTKRTAAARLAEVFERASYVSHNVLAEFTADDFAKGERIAARVVWLNNRFQLGFHPRTLQTWSRPTDLPLAQSFPVSPGAERDQFLDSNRGMLPYRIKQDATATQVNVDFRPERLPVLTTSSPPSPLVEPGTPPQDTPWIILPDFQGAQFFLPTLPGVELLLGTDANDSRWMYRHSVPALDEAYAEVTQSAGANPLTGEIRVGLDFTRVDGTEAFQVRTDNLPSETPARGWLHRRRDNREGQVAITLDSLNLKGRSPHLQFLLENDAGKKVRFVRQDGPAELNNVSLNVSQAPAPGSLDGFHVSIGQTDADDATLKIVNNGQPLVAHFTGERVVTLDAQGLVLEEAWGPQARLLPLAASQPVVRRTTGFRLVHGIEPLDLGRLKLAGISEGTFDERQTALETSGFHEEGWMMHDGHGDWPRLFGFPLFPLKLEKFTDTGGTINAIIHAAWLPRVPAEGEVEPPRDGAGMVVLEFSGPAASDTLAVAKITGSIDWRFPSPAGVERHEPRIVRVVAQVDTPITAGMTSLALTLQEVAVEHAAGSRRLRTATLPSG